MKWEDHLEVRAYKEYKNWYWGVFCKNTGKRYGQGERAKGGAIKKAERVFAGMLEKVDRIILSDDR